MKSQLLQLFDAAMDEGLSAANPVRGIRARKPRQEQRPADEDAAEVWTYLDADEQRRILTCALPSPRAEAERFAVLFALGTGLRLGEQMNLELRDLHVDGPAPHVFVRWGSKGRRPKSGKTRTVPLFGVALEAARRWLEFLSTYAPKNPLGLVFPLPTGTRRRPSRHLQRGTGNSIDGFREILTAARIVRHVNWHALRHTCASSLVAGWWGVVWGLDRVRTLLGHASIRMTERYAHLAPAVLDDLAAHTMGLRPAGGQPGDSLRAITGGSRSDHTSASASC